MLNWIKKLLNPESMCKTCGKTKEELDTVSTDKGFKLHQAWCRKKSIKRLYRYGK